MKYVWQEVWHGSQQVTEDDGKTLKIKLTQRNASEWGNSSLKKMADDSNCTDKAKATLQHFIEQETTVRLLLRSVVGLPYYL
jgi:hypothetical protein